MDLDLATQLNTDPSGSRSRAATLPISQYCAAKLKLLYADIYGMSNTTGPDPGRKLKQDPGLFELKRKN
jgi:hypothetical protein